jgi:predicted TPR repeat methyltransferase
MLAVATGKSAPEQSLPRHIPVSLAKAHFDSVAPDFKNDQLETLGYQGHVLLADAVRQSIVPGRLDHIILELGVGTGLCGPRLRDVAAQLVGVDLSAAMLAEAMKTQDLQGRKVYDALINRELHDFLAESASASYDIVLACGVVSYIGDLQELYRQVARVLKPGGLFAFTADAMAGQSFRFDPDAGRFRFSPSYLRELAAANAMKEVMCKEAAVYPDYKAWLCVFAI